MELPGLITAIFLASLAVTVLVCLCLLLFVPLYRLLRTGADSSRAHKAAAALGKVDQLIEKAQYPEALRQLRRNFVFDTPVSARTVEALKEHNQNLLSRCLVIAEEMSKRAPNIAEVEGLLLARSELQELFLKVNVSYHTLKSRRDQAGKKMPTWSKSDFEARIEEIRKELRQNEEMLKKELDLLFGFLSEDARENIIYH